MFQNLFSLRLGQRAFGERRERIRIRMVKGDYRNLQTFFNDFGYFFHL